MNKVGQSYDEAKAEALQKELDNMKILNKVEFAIETEGECFAIQIIERLDGKHLNVFKRNYSSEANFNAVQAKLIDVTHFFDDLNKKQNFGRKIKELHIAAGMAPYDLCKKANLSRVTIATVEEGFEELTVNEAKKIADALNVSVDELLED